MTRRRRARGESEFREAFAARVKYLRKERGWSQDELAKALGKGKMQVFRIESPAPGVPTTLGLAEELAHVFDMELTAFLAPILGAKDAEALEDQAKRERMAEVEARIEALISEKLGNLGRPGVAVLVRHVALAGGYLSDAELAYELETWSHRAHFRVLHRDSERLGIRVTEVPPMPEAVGSGR